TIAYFLGITGTGDSSALLIGTIVVGALAAVLGGYVTGYISRRDERTHAFALAGFALVIAIISIVVPNTDIPTPLLYNIINILVMIPGVWLGGYWREKQRRRKVSPPYVPD